MRLLRGEAGAQTGGRRRRRIYDEAERNALVLLWEASDRVCGKRLKASMPVLIEAMERHGHLELAADIRAKLLAMSAATIDRALARVREGLGRRRRRPAAHALRSSIPIRTSADWGDPSPGFVEADLVAHSGPSARGSFIQTLVLTDIATGWTECAPLIVREQTLLSTPALATKARARARRSSGGRPGPLGGSGTKASRPITSSVVTRRPNASVIGSLSSRIQGNKKPWM